MWALEVLKTACIHPPVVSVEMPVFTAEPGEAVALCGEAYDPEGKKVSHHWFIYRDGSHYHGQASDLRVWEPVSLRTHFTIPVDAKEVDWFNILLQVRTEDEIGITRYGQVIVKVTESQGGQEARRKNLLEDMT